MSCSRAGMRSFNSNNSASANPRISGSDSMVSASSRACSAARKSPMRATTGSISDNSRDALT